MGFMKKRTTLKIIVCLTILNYIYTYVKTKKRLEFNVPLDKGPNKMKDVTKEKSNMQKNKNPDSEPVMIIELFSNGASTPSYKIKRKKLGDFYNNPEDLLTTGMRQHFNLGQHIATKYPNLFSEVDSQYRHKYEMISIEKYKNIESAYSHLLGIYGLTKSPTINTKFMKKSM